MVGLSISGLPKRRIDDQIKQGITGILKQDIQARLILLFKSRPFKGSL